MTGTAAAILGLLSAADPLWPRLEDATERSGIEFRHVCGSPEKNYIFEVNGGGVALFDADGDGDLDIFLVNGSRFDLAPGEARPTSALYRNDGGFRFVDVTAAAGVGLDAWGASAAAADVDNDGDTDLYVTCWGPNALFLNRGDGTFERRADSGAEDPRMSASASFADFNRDGLVDLYVANYVEIDRTSAKRRGDPACSYKGVPIFCGPGGLTPAPDSFFLNRGGGRFEDASVAWGVRSVSASYGLGTLVVDLDRNGFPDVVVANDTSRNHAFLNEGGRGFREAAVYLGIAYNDFGIAQAGMGLASGDLRGLGQDDIFLTTFEDDTNTLYIQEPGGMYTDGTFPAGLGGPSYSHLGWGTFFFDVENDGDLDIFVANGHVAPQADSIRSSPGYRQPCQLFLNDSLGRFTECPAAASPGLQSRKSSRGAACGDLDSDGDLDVVVNNMDDRPTILENRSGGGNAWLAVNLRGTRSNRSAIGARVAVVSGGRRQERTLQSGMSYASHCELTARFGLGKSAEVDSLRVDWPSGLTEAFPQPRPGSVVLLVEGTGTPVPLPAGSR